jgi:hypothetical protein
MMIRILMLMKMLRRILTRPPDQPAASYKRAIQKKIQTRSRLSPMTTITALEATRREIDNTAPKTAFWVWCEDYALMNSPNMSLHRRNDSHHQIGLEIFTELVQAKLKNNWDNDCKPLGLQGARGALFKLALPSHGYTFVGKGTVKHYIPALLHDGRVYDRLKDVQGTAVPVYLGNIDLLPGYHLDLDVDIKHFLLLSY